MAPAYVHLDEAARKRAERLARSTVEQAEASLAFLSAIDPLMFDIAVDADDLAADRDEVSKPPATQPPGDESHPSRVSTAATMAS